jgi:hypothetical protein
MVRRQFRVIACRTRRPIDQHRTLRLGTIGTI